MSQIPDSINKLLANPLVVDALEEFENEELQQAQNVLIITAPQADRVIMRYAGLSSLEVIGVLEAAKNLMFNGGEYDG